MAKLLIILFNLLLLDDGMRYYWKSLNLRHLDDQVIDRFVKHARLQPSVFSTVDLWHIGGGVTRVNPEENAFNYHYLVWTIRVPDWDRSAPCSPHSLWNFGTVISSSTAGTFPSR
jgi:hypothetical protein